MASFGRALNRGQRGAAHATRPCGAARFQPKECPTTLRVLVPFRAIVRQLGLGSGLVQAAPCLGLRFRRPRLPASRTVAHPVVGITASIASTNSTRSSGRAASNFGANAVSTCLAPLKLI